MARVTGLGGIFYKVADPEANVIYGVEEARNADEGGVRTSQVPADDVPPEYLDQEIPGRG